VTCDHKVQLISSFDYSVINVVHWSDVNGNGREWEESLVTEREWELNRRHHGNGIGNGNKLMGMGGNGNVATHSRTSLMYTHLSVAT